MNRILISFLCVFFVVDSFGQEFFSGPKNTTETISRTGTTNFGYTQIRNNQANGATILEHTHLIGNLFIRSSRGGTTGDVGDVIINDNAGNIGMGIAAPQSFLHVKGDVRFERGVGGNNFISLTADASGNYIATGDVGANMKNLFIRATPTGDNALDRHLYFQTGKVGGEYQTRLFIAGSGNVGIGTVDPKAKLAVDGNIIAKEIKVNTNIAVPDYVFEPDYKLPKLSAIKDFVASNKHLPEVPSAKEISANGLDLAEMNLLLLKKVEELTLHLIEKDIVLTEVLRRLDEIESKQ